MSWKTTVFGLLAAIGASILGLYAVSPDVLAGFPVWLKGAAALASAIGTAGVGVFARDNNKTSEDVGAGKDSGGVQLRFLFIIVAIFAAFIFCFTGCARFNSRMTRTDADGSVVESRQSVTTFFDAKSDIAKLRASTTDKTQGLTVGSISEETSGTNAVSLIHAVVDAAVSAAAKSAVPVKP